MNFLLSVIIVTLISFITTTTLQAQLEPQDIILLNHRYNNLIASDNLVGEVYNNDSKSHDRSDIDILLVFHDADGNLIDTKEAYIYTDTLHPLDKDSFKVTINDGDPITTKAVSYDIILNDERVIDRSSIYD